MGISANAAPLERGLAVGKTRQIPVISTDSLYSFPMEISFFPFCANKFRKRMPGPAFRIVISSNGFSWCFPHSLDHDPNLWHLFPDSLAVAVVRKKMCKSFDSRKLPVPSRWGGKKWELAPGPPLLPLSLQTQRAKMMWKDEANYFIFLGEG